MNKATERLKELTRPTGEEDLLNVQYPTPRWEVSPKHAVIVASVAVMLMGAWFVLRPAPPVQSPDAPDWANLSSASAAPQAPESVVVSVVGEVQQPGLVTLPQGSRVADALEHAQVLPSADMLALNQAQMLTDGQQIHVVAEGAAPPATQSDGLISLNSATASELTELDGVGDATAAAIIAHREENGPFTDIEQLLDVSGIGPAKFAGVKDHVGL